MIQKPHKENIRYDIGGKQLEKEFMTVSLFLSAQLSPALWQDSFNYTYSSTPKHATYAQWFLLFNKLSSIMTVVKLATKMELKNFFGGRWMDDGVLAITKDIPIKQKKAWQIENT